MIISPEVSARTLALMAKCCTYAEATFTMIANSKAHDISETHSVKELNFSEFEAVWLTHMKLPLTSEQVEALVTFVGTTVQEEGVGSCGIWVLAHGAYHMYTDLNPLDEQASPH